MEFVCWLFLKKKPHQQQCCGALIRLCFRSNSFHGGLFWPGDSTPKDFSCVAVFIEQPRGSSQRVCKIAALDSYARHGNLVDAPLVACWDYVGGVLLPVQD